MAKKKSKVVLEAPAKMKPTLYLYSGSGVKIPESVKKSKLGKTLNLRMKARVIGQHLTRDIGREQSESYELEIQKITTNPKSKLEKVLRS